MTRSGLLLVVQRCFVVSFVFAVLSTFSALMIKQKPRRNRQESDSSPTRFIFFSRTECVGICCRLLLLLFCCLLASVRPFLGAITKLARSPAVHPSNDPSFSASSARVLEVFSLSTVVRSSLLLVAPFFFPNSLDHGLRHGENCRFGHVDQSFALFRSGRRRWLIVVGIEISLS